MLNPMSFRYNLTREEQEIFDKNESINHHTENIVFLAEILTREFPSHETWQHSLIQANAIKSIHDKARCLPLLANEFRYALEKHIEWYLNWKK